MILDIISITSTRRKRRIKFSDEEYMAIKILTDQQIKVMREVENPDDNLNLVIGVLESINTKVKHK